MKDLLPIFQEPGTIVLCGGEQPSARPLAGFVSFSLRLQSPVKPDHRSLIGNDSGSR